MIATHRAARGALILVSPPIEFGDSQAIYSKPCASRATRDPLAKLSRHRRLSTDPAYGSGSVVRPSSGPPEFLRIAGCGAGRQYGQVQPEISGLSVPCSCA